MSHNILLPYRKYLWLTNTFSYPGNKANQDICIKYTLCLIQSHRNVTWSELKFHNSQKSLQWDYSILDTYSHTIITIIHMQATGI